MGDGEGGEAVLTYIHIGEMHMYACITVYSCISSILKELYIEPPPPPLYIYIYIYIIIIVYI